MAIVTEHLLSCTWICSWKASDRRNDRRRSRRQRRLATPPQRYGYGAHIDNGTEETTTLQPPKRAC